eukprot:gene16423-19424_t
MLPGRDQTRPSSAVGKGECQRLSQPPPSVIVVRKVAPGFEAFDLGGAVRLADDPDAAPSGASDRF